jgi:hypothetical protein
MDEDEELRVIGAADAHGGLDIEVSQEDQTEAPPRGHTLLDTDDAMLWAEEFCRIFVGKVVTTEESEGADVGLMVSWFANAIETGRRFGMESLNCDGPFWAFTHFYNMDKANAAMHCAPVRFSPITFRLAEFLRSTMPLLSLHSPEYVEVMDHLGRYPEDSGR